MAPPTFNPLAKQIARELLSEYLRYMKEFNKITAGAKERFEKQQWRKNISALTARYHLFFTSAPALSEKLQHHYRLNKAPRALWDEIKKELFQWTRDWPDAEIVQSYFYAVRRFRMPGDTTPSFPYVDQEEMISSSRPRERFISEFRRSNGTAELIEAVLTKHPFSKPYWNPKLTAQRVAGNIDEYLIKKTGTSFFSHLEFMDLNFYRENGCYLIGKLYVNDAISLPIVLALDNLDKGIVVSGVVIGNDRVRNALGHSVPSFFVDFKWHRELIDYLTTVLPDVERASLYRTIGYNAHHQAVLFRHTMRLLNEEGERFEETTGSEGTVMLCFRLKGLRFVFKMIKDTEVIRWSKPGATKEKILGGYHVVLNAGRKGSVLPAIPYEELTFDKKHFDPDLLERLLEYTSESCSVNGDKVILKNILIQRETTPLKDYIKERLPGESDEEFFFRVRRVLIEYGYCLKHLAYAGVWPADIHMGNAGVTASGKVVWFDHDEARPLLQVKFLKGEEPYSDVRGYSSNDVFPEDPKFLFIPESHREAFEKAHGDLRTVEFWNAAKKAIQAGTVITFYPFPPQCLVDPTVRASYEGNQFITLVVCPAAPVDSSL